MNIAGTDYCSQYKAYEVYVAGCTIKCPACHNPELQDFNIGTPYKDWITDKLPTLRTLDKSLVDKIFIVGGEPLDQPPEELDHLIDVLKANTDCEIWLFTGRDDPKVFDGPWFKQGKLKGENKLHVIKVGPYDPKWPPYKSIDSSGFELPSGNQQLFRFIMPVKAQPEPQPSVQHEDIQLETIISETLDRTQ